MTETLVLKTDNICVFCPTYPDKCSYVRIRCRRTWEEIAYWDSLEWKEDPEGVMGAIMGLMKGR